jgi:hypothetical protein
VTETSSAIVESVEQSTSRTHCLIVGAFSNAAAAKRHPKRKSKPDKSPLEAPLVALAVLRLLHFFAATVHFNLL